MKRQWTPATTSPEHAESSTSTKIVVHRKEIPGCTKPTTEDEMCLDETGLDYIKQLSLEVLSHIFSYVSVLDVLKLEALSKKLQAAVIVHLRIRKVVDFSRGNLYCSSPGKLTDSTLLQLFRRCKDLRFIYGFHPVNVVKRRSRKTGHLSVRGVVDALSQLWDLRGIELSNVFLLEAVMTYLPIIEIIGMFKNRNPRIPPSGMTRISLPANPRITSLNLTGVVVSELPPMEYVKHIHLSWVKLNQHPFKEFKAPNLKTFVMTNCAGPTNALKYVPLMTALALARSLSRLVLIRVPFLGGLIQHLVEEYWRIGGFRWLQFITMGTCKHALEVDLGVLVISCAFRLEELCIQPSLTKDSFFSCLNVANIDFPFFDSLTLGYVDPLAETGKWTNKELVLFGLADITESPAMITDIGMRVAGKVFRLVKRMEIYNCPHLHYPTTWISNVGHHWRGLRELTLRRCHAIRLADFCRFIPMLPVLESLHLESMFKEPPKGCSRVGLSAGTGLGVSSALVSNTGNEAGNNDDDIDEDEELANEIAVNNNNNGELANQQAADNNPPLASSSSNAEEIIPKPGSSSEDLTSLKSDRNSSNENEKTNSCNGPENDNAMPSNSDNALPEIYSSVSKKNAYNAASYKKQTGQTESIITPDERKEPKQDCEVNRPIRNELTQKRPLQNKSGQNIRSHSTNQTSQASLEIIESSEPKIEANVDKKDQPVNDSLGANRKRNSTSPRKVSTSNCGTSTDSIKCKPDSKNIVESSSALNKSKDARNNQKRNERKRKYAANDVTQNSDKSPKCYGNTKTDRKKEKDAQNSQLKSSAILTDPDCACAVCKAGSSQDRDPSLATMDTGEDGRHQLNRDSISASSDRKIPVAENPASCLDNVDGLNKPLRVALPFPAPAIPGKSLIGCSPGRSIWDETECQSSNDSEALSENLETIETIVTNSDYQIQVKVTVVPTDVTVIPTDVTVVPTDVTVVPTDVTVIPTDVTVIPTDVIVIPTDVTVKPTDVIVIPTDVPADVTVIPTDANPLTKPEECTKINKKQILNSISSTSTIVSETVDDLESSPQCQMLQMKDQVHHLPSDIRAHALSSEVKVQDKCITINSEINKSVMGAIRTQIDGKDVPNPSCSNSDSVIRRLVKELPRPNLPSLSTDSEAEGSETKRRRTESDCSVSNLQRNESGEESDFKLLESQGRSRSSCSRTSVKGSSKVNGKGKGKRKKSPQPPFRDLEAKFEIAQQKSKPGGHCLQESSQALFMDDDVRPSTSSKFVTLCADADNVNDVSPDLQENRVDDDVHNQTESATKHYDNVNDCRRTRPQNDEEETLTIRDFDELLRFKEDSPEALKNSDEESFVKPPNVNDILFEEEDFEEEILTVTVSGDSSSSFLSTPSKFEAQGNKSMNSSDFLIETKSKSDVEAAEMDSLENICFHCQIVLKPDDDSALFKRRFCQNCRQSLISKPRKINNETKCASDSEIDKKGSRELAGNADNKDSFSERKPSKGKNLKGKTKSYVKHSGGKVSQACQAVSDEIRETTKKAKENEGVGKIIKPRTNQKNPSAATASALRGADKPTNSTNVNIDMPSTSVDEGISDTKESSPSITRQPNSCDQSTSTSDPVIEDDHVQVLTVRSRSLVNLTLHRVGVTDIILQDCPFLNSIQAKSCRVLKKVTIQKVNHLQHFTFAQCKKLDERHLVEEICKLPVRVSRNVFLRPMKELDTQEIERLMFKTSPFHYQMCLIRDFCLDPEETVYNHTRIMEWSDMFFRVNYDLTMCQCDFPIADNKPAPHGNGKYPWGRRIYTMQGKNADSTRSSWDLMTDIPWLRPLSERPDVNLPNLSPADFLEGVYCPKVKGQSFPSSLMEHITLHKAELQEAGLGLFHNSVIVYINMCDMDGVPTPDVYV